VVPTARPRQALALVGGLGPALELDADLPLRALTVGLTADRPAGPEPTQTLPEAVGVVLARATIPAQPVLAADESAPTIPGLADIDADLPPGVAAAPGDAISVVGATLALVARPVLADLGPPTRSLIAAAVDTAVVHTEAVSGAVLVAEADTLDAASPPALQGARAIRRLGARR